MTTRKVSARSVFFSLAFWPSVISSVLILGTGLVLYNTKAEAPVSTSSRSLEATLARLEAQISTLNERIDTLERMSNASPPVVASASSQAQQKVQIPQAPSSKNEEEEARPYKDNESSLSKRLPPEDLNPEQAAHALEARREKLDAHWDNEPVDPEWAGEAEAQLLEDLSGESMGTAYLTDAECRSSLCRVELAHPEADGLDDLVIQLGPRPAFAGRRMIILQDTLGDTGQATVYVARIGHRLPES